jgi:acetyl-CoA carboxylase carboxyltransferase component
MDKKQAALDELKRRREIAQAMGGPERIARQRQRGHLTARERLDKLLDPGTWIEMGALEQFTAPDGQEYHVNKIHGFGKIDGRTVIVQSDDSTILAGTGGRDVSSARRQKGLHPPLTPELNFPVIRLGESGGVHMQSVMGSLGVLAVTFPGRTLLNPRKTPHITAILGYCFGDPSWQAALSDFVVQVKGTCMAVSGPRVLEVALQEKTTPEELGGWELHAEVTGQVDAFAEDEEHCMQIIREFLSYMPSHCDEEPPYLPPTDPAERKTGRLMKIIPDKSNQIYDMNRVIKEIVDDGKYFILKPFFGKALITCLARMNGRVVGIIANQTLYNGGAAGAEECEKASSFIVLCDSFNIPLVHIADTPGFLVGKPAERRKIPLKIMTWMEALALATVPKITVIIRKAYGMGISNMCGPNCGADFISALTTAEISFMSPEAAANVVWAKHIAEADDPEAERERLIKEMEYGSAPWEAAAGGWLDDVLDPHDTRQYIIDRLEIMHSRKNGFISDKLLQNWPTGF